MNQTERIVRNMAENIQREMEKQDISGLALARMTGCNPMTVNHCINARRVPNAPLVLAIARALKTTVEALATDPAKRKPATRAKQTV